MGGGGKKAEAICTFPSAGVPHDSSVIREPPRSGGSCSLHFRRGNKSPRRVKRPVPARGLHTPVGCPLQTQRPDRVMSAPRPAPPCCRSNGRTGLTAWLAPRAATCLSRSRIRAPWLHVARQQGGVFQCRYAERHQLPEDGARAGWAVRCVPVTPGPWLGLC